MVFASPTFLFLFLPIYFIVFYLLPSRRRSTWILLASWVFYGWWRLDFLMLLVVAAVGAGFLGRLIHTALEEHDLLRARRRLVVGVIGALGLLGYFKYFNFGVDSLTRLLEVFGVVSPTVWRVVLPVGISFYIFQIVSYLVDVYRGVSSPGRSVLEIASYVSLFPQLVAGPIVRYVEVSADFREPGASARELEDGARRLMLGVVKKVVIADAVAPLADIAFGLSQPSFFDAWLGLLAYSIQIYFDFAAYSDMAIGLGKMMGFSFPENFNRPYAARSITEFWRRWHMTLSRWLRDYLYIPLGGNQISPSRTLINLLLVMTIGGLWHGAAWTFVMWGLWHGILLVLERIGFIRGRREPVMRVRTLLFVGIGWVLFRSASIVDAAVFLRALAGFSGFLLAEAFVWDATVGMGVALLVGVVFAVLEGRALPFRWVRPALAPLFVLSLVRVLAASYSPFLYFQF